MNQNQATNLCKDSRNWIISILNGRPAIPHNPADYQDLVSSAELEGVTALVYSTLIERAPQSDLAARFKDQVRQHAARAMLLQEERIRVLQILNNDEPLVLKGEAMAYACYRQYQERPMTDLDILVKDNRFKSISNSLIETGYRRADSSSGDLVMPQISFSKKLTRSVTNVLDVHTALFNRPGLQNMLDYEELLIGAQLGKHPAGLIPSLGNLLIHASLHLMAHHFNSRRLIWLYDIKLLLENMSDDDNQHVISFCQRHRLAAAILKAVEASRLVFPSEYCALSDQLKMQAAEQTVPHIATGLLKAESQSSLAIQDWNSLRGIRQRLAWLRQHLLPAPDYMMRRYNLVSKWRLPFYYLWRILRGSVKIFGSR